MLAYGLSRNKRQAEQILVDPDLLRRDMILPEPAPVERGMLCGIPDRVPDPFIDESIQIIPAQCLDLR